MIPTFIISILESQRNERAYQIVKNSTLPISIFPGVSINEVKIEGDNIYYCNELIHYNREKCLNLHNRLLSPGEIGCAQGRFARLGAVAAHESVFEQVLFDGRDRSDHPRVARRKVADL